MHSIAALNPTPAPALAQDVSERLRARSRATGALVMTAFSALWSGLAGVGTPAAPLPLTAVALIAGLLALAAARVFRENPAVRDPLPAELAGLGRRGRRVLAWACVGEGVGILLAVNLVVNLGHPQWRAAAIMAVVGLHFLPLGAGFRYRPHLVTGVAMTAWALAYPWLFAAGAVTPAGPLVAGAMLFASAAWALRRTGRSAR